MEDKKNKTVWTIGHSTRPLEEFIMMLQSFEIKLVADIRRYPGSRKFPQYNQDTLALSLPQNNISYCHLESLGGRRKAKADSLNTGWKNAGFRGYADYLETPDFKNGISELENLIGEQHIAYMCSEAVWWRCHRAIVSDYLKAKGYKVMHIMAIGKAEEHPYTSPARIVQGNLTYGGDSREGTLFE